MFIKETLITLIKLKEVLNKYDWTDEILKNSNDINELFNIFLQTLGEIVDHHPLLNKVTKVNLQLKPWISKKIKHLMCKEITCSESIVPAKDSYHRKNLIYNLPFQYVNLRRNAYRKIIIKPP